MVGLDNLFFIWETKKWPLVALDRWSSYQVTTVWEFASTDSALVILDKRSFWQDWVYFKLPFDGLQSKITQKKVDQLCKRFRESLKVKLIFTSEKLQCIFSLKEPYQSEYLFKVVYTVLYVIAVMQSDLPTFGNQNRWILW